MRSLSLQAGVAAIVLALNAPLVLAQGGGAGRRHWGRSSRFRCCGDRRCFSIRDDGQPGNGAFLCYWRNDGSRRRAAILDWRNQRKCDSQRHGPCA